MLLFSDFLFVRTCISTNQKRTCLDLSVLHGAFAKKASYWTRIPGDALGLRNVLATTPARATMTARLLRKTATSGKESEAPEFHWFQLFRRVYFHPFNSAHARAGSGRAPRGPALLHAPLGVTRTTKPSTGRCLTFTELVTMS